MVPVVTRIIGRRAGGGDGPGRDRTPGQSTLSTEAPALVTRPRRAGPPTRRPAGRGQPAAEARRHEGRGRRSGWTVPPARALPDTWSRSGLHDPARPWWGMAERTVRPQPGGGRVVNRCGGGWSAVADAPSAPARVRPAAAQVIGRRGRRPRTAAVNRCGGQQPGAVVEIDGGLPAGGGLLSDLVAQEGAHPRPARLDVPCILPGKQVQEDPGGRGPACAPAAVSLHDRRGQPLDQVAGVVVRRGRRDDVQAVSTDAVIGELRAEGVHGARLVRLGRVRAELPVDLPQPLKGAVRMPWPKPGAKSPSALSGSSPASSARSPPG